MDAGTGTHMTDTDVMTMAVVVVVVAVAGKWGPCPVADVLAVAVDRSDKAQ